jgi:hypothetical protein
MSDLSVIAIIAAYNEADIIDQVVADLIDQEIQIYFLDDDSTDGTAGIVEQHLGNGVIAVERLRAPVDASTSAAFGWQSILARKAELAQTLDADWFIHHDADEFRESPWPQLSLRAAIQRVDELGFNAIDFACLNFWPVNDEFQPGEDVRAALPFYALSEAFDRLQIRCWKKGQYQVDLASSGGHDVHFPGRNVFPIRFILRHYPIRSERHGRQKVFQERRARYLAEERARGWHVQYDHLRESSSFLRTAQELRAYDADAVRVELALRHRGVEQLEAALTKSQSDAERLTAEFLTQLERSHEALRAVTDERAALGAELEQRGAVLVSVQEEASRTREELVKTQMELAGSTGRLSAAAVALDLARARIEDIERSRSWRWMAPLRWAHSVIASMTRRISSPSPHSSAREGGGKHVS